MSNQPTNLPTNHSLLHPLVHLYRASMLALKRRQRRGATADMEIKPSEEGLLDVPNTFRFSIEITAHIPKGREARGKKRESDQKNQIRVTMLHARTFSAVTESPRRQTINHEAGAGRWTRLCLNSDDALCIRHTLTHASLHCPPAADSSTRF